ncbi:unnamed protein product, partial [Amoebophrya sp. A120]
AEEDDALAHPAVQLRDGALGGAQTISPQISRGLLDYHEPHAGADYNYVDQRYADAVLGGGGTQHDVEMDARPPAPGRAGPLSTPPSTDDSEQDITARNVVDPSQRGRERARSGSHDVAQEHHHPDNYLQHDTAVLPAGGQLRQAGPPTSSAVQQQNLGRYYYASAPSAAPSSTPRAGVGGAANR